MHETYVQKNADYGDSFHQTYRKFGIISCIVRISDKYHRLVNLTQSGSNPTFESLRDTLLDLANYCLLTVMELDMMKGGKGDSNT